MLKELLSIFANPEPPSTPMPDADAQHALGALLVRVAKADKAYLFSEIEQIDLLLSDLFDLNPVEAARMRAGCEKLEEAMPDTPDLARILRSGISDPDKDRFIAGLWRVSEADGFRHESETEVVALASQALGMAPERAEALRTAQSD